MNTYVFNMRGPTGTVEFYEDDLKSIIWEKDEDDCWVSYDPIPCVSEPEDPEVYVYDFRVCGDDLFVGGADVTSIYSTNGRWKLIEDWKKLLDVPEDIEESRRPRGRMLKESEYEGYPYRVSDIDWETDGEDVDLPDEVIVDVPEEIVENGGDEVDYISDYLSDTYGFLQNGFVVDGPLEDEDLEESRRPRGRMLKEAHRNHTDFIPYTMRQYYNEYDKKWHPCVVYINSRDNGDWWIELFDDEGTNEIGWDYEKFTKNGTSKCDPEEAKWIEDTFISDCKEYGSVPPRRVSRLRNFGSGNNYIGKM